MTVPSMPKSSDLAHYLDGTRTFGVYSSLYFSANQAENAYFCRHILIGLPLE